MDQPASRKPERTIDPRNIEVIDDATVLAMRRVPPAERVVMLDGMWELSRLMDTARPHRCDNGAHRAMASERGA